MTLSIGIVNWKTRDLLERCLTSIERDVDPKGNSQTTHHTTEVPSCCANIFPG